MAEVLSTKIAENVTKAASASNDSGAMAHHNLSDQIEALNFFENRKAISGKRRGIMFAKFVPRVHLEAVCRNSIDVPDSSANRRQSPSSRRAI